MATGFAQWERERFNYGEVANDKKGDPIRIHAIKAEHTDNLIFSWLSGGASETRLPDVLPVSRGGTGSSTVAGTLRNLGYFEDTNHTLRRGVKILSLTNTGILDRFNNLPNATFTRRALGEYVLRGVQLDTQLYGMVFPVDKFDQLRYIATTTIGSEGEIVVKVFKANNATNPPSNGVASDLPVGVYIDIECK